MLFVTATGVEEPDWQRVKLAASKSGNVADRFPGWWETHKDKLMGIPSLSLALYRSINKGLHTTKRSMAKLVNSKRQSLIDERAAGYQKCLTKCSFCGKDKMVPIWLGSKGKCLNDVCAARQSRGQAAAAANVTARGHIINNIVARDTCKQCKCLPGNPKPEP